MTLAALALSGAGAMGQAQTNSSYMSELNNQNKIAADMTRDFRMAEQDRQDAYDEEAFATVDTAHDAVSRENFDTERTDAATNFVAELNARPDALNGAADMHTASDDVKRAAAAITSQEAGKSRERIAALANLSSYGSTGQSRARDLNNGSNFLSMLGGLRRGSLGVSAQEQAITPASVQRGDDSFAQLLSGAGMVAGMAGPSLFGGSLFGGAPANAAGLPTGVAQAGTAVAPGGGLPMLPALY